jgi:hypothetical protein
VVTTRHVLAQGSPRPDTVKLITFIRRSPAAAEHDFHSALLGPYAAAFEATGPLRHELLITIPDRPKRQPFSAQAIDLQWFASEHDALAWTASEHAHRASWQLAGLAFGSERLIARPLKIV